MKSITIDGINIKYTDSYLKDIDRIEKIIERYSFLFSYFGYFNLILDNKDEKDDSGFHIDDFDSFFDNFFMRLTQNEELKVLLKENAIPILYYAKLVKKAGVEDNSFFDLDGLDENLLYLAVALKRFKLPEQFKEFSSFLKMSNEEEILGWVKENERYNVYNFLCKTALSSLKVNDSSFYDNLQDLYVKFFEEFSNENYSFIEHKNTNLNKLSFEDFVKLFLEFLDYIGASSWKEEFVTLLQENRIIFEEMNEDNESKYFMDDDGVTKIRVSNDGSLSSFTSLAREFAHYISCENKNPAFLLLEFPSIYFENVAADFLIKKGFGDDTLKNVLYSRDLDNKRIFSCLSPFFIDLMIYLKERAITPQILYEYYGNLGDNSSHEEKDKSKESEFSSLKKILDTSIDSKITFYVENGSFFFDGCQYLFGTLLSYNCLDNYNEKTNKDMVRITENLDKYDVLGIIDYLNTHNFTFDDSYVKKKKGNL